MTHFGQRVDILTKLKEQFSCFLKVILRNNLGWVMDFLKLQKYLKFAFLNHKETIEVRDSNLFSIKKNFHWVPIFMSLLARQRKDATVPDLCRCSPVWITLILFVSGYVWYACATAYVWRSEDNLQKSILLFYLLGPGDWIKGIRCRDRNIYQMNHSASCEC